MGIVGLSDSQEVVVAAHAPFWIIKVGWLVAPRASPKRRETIKAEEQVD
jgi:hypothetical protein